MVPQFVPYASDAFEIIRFRAEDFGRGVGSLDAHATRSASGPFFSKEKSARRSSWSSGRNRAMMAVSNAPSISVLPMSAAASSARLASIGTERREQALRSSLRRGFPWRAFPRSSSGATIEAIHPRWMNRELITTRGRPGRRLAERARDINIAASSTVLGAPPFLPLSSALGPDSPRAHVATPRGSDGSARVWDAGGQRFRVAGAVGC